MLSEDTARLSATTRERQIIGHLRASAMALRLLNGTT